MICTFCGNSCCNTAELYPVMKIEVERLILSGVVVFYSGGYGAFDMLALRVVGELKAKYPHIKNILVFAYLSELHTSKYRDALYSCNAESLYPFEIKIPPRLAIIKRNEWMVARCDFVISGTKHLFGGCGKTLEFAKRKNKTIIYI